MSCSEAAQGDIVIPAYINGEPVTAIHDYAFLFCASVTAVTIPETVTRLGDYSFYCCTALETVTVSGSLEHTGNRSFYRCSNLKTVTFQGAVKAVGIYSFAYCTALSQVEFQSTVAALGSYSFYFCSALTQIALPGVTVIGNYAFSGSGLVALPVDSCGETLSINSHAFSQCAGLTSVALPSSVGTLGDGVFSDCVNLRSADLHSVTASKMPARLFSGCTSLVSVDLPASWTAISDEAFYNCAALQYTMTTGLTSIGSWAFCGCVSLGQNLVIPSGVTEIGTGAFRYCNPGSVTIPVGVTEILDYTFDACPNLTSLTLPEGLLSVGTYAFGGNALKSLSLPSTLETLGDCAFGDSAPSEEGAEDGIACTGTVSKIELPAGLTSIGIGALDCCTQINMDELTLPEGLTYIGSLFGGYKKLVLPASLQTVEPLAFAENETLEEVVILCNSSAFGTTDGNGFGMYSAKNVAYFNGCSNLTKFSIPDNWTEIPMALFYGTGIISLEIPEGIIKIGTSAFAQCTALKSIKLPSTLSVIYHAAFAGCENLSDIEFPSGLTYIGKRAFFETSALSTVEIPCGVELAEEAFSESGMTFLYLSDNVVISNYAFQNCTNLKEITVNANLEGTAVFTGCTNLETVTFGEGVTEIPYGCFSGCKNLETVHLPNSIKIIGYSAFANCTLLSEVNFPEGLEEIRESAFQNTALTDVHLPSTLTRLDPLSFADIPTLTSVWLSDGTANDAFRVLCYNPTREDWEDVSGIEGLRYYQMGQGASESEESAFSGCSALSEIHIPSGWTYIPAKFLKNCSGNFELELGDKITDIGSNAFDGAAGLSKIVLPDGLLSIGDFAFNGCTGLTELVLPEKLQTIGSYAIYGCTGLTELVLPDSFPEDGLAAYALAGCPNLREVSLPANWTVIPDGLFQGNLSIESYEIPEGVVRVGEYAFADSALKEVSLPGTLLEIGEGAFQNCKLTSVALPDGIKALGKSAFRGSALKTIVVPGTVGTIESLAFCGCSDLESVIIEQGVTTINGLAFAYCEELKEASIPDSTIYLARTIFYGCGIAGVKVLCSEDSMAEVLTQSLLYLYSDYTPALENAQFTFYEQNFLFSETNTSEEVYIEGGISYIYLPFAYADYQYSVEYNGMNFWIINQERRNFRMTHKANADQLYIEKNGISNYYGVLYGWDESFASLVIPDEIRGVLIKQIMLQKGYSGLRSLTIGANIEIVDNDSKIYLCTELENLILSNSMVSIGIGAFQNLESLTNVVFPASIQSIEENAFRDCTNLSSITFSEGLTSIAEGAFLGTALTDVYLPSTLESLHANSFETDVIFHFTGNVSTIKYIYYTIGDDGTEVITHEVYALPDLLESQSAQIAQFTGNGLDNQDTYFISTETAGLSESAENESQIGDVTTSADTSSVLDNLDDIENEIVYEESEDDITPETAEETPEETHIYELVLKAVDAVQENPLVFALAICAVVALMAVGGLQRWHRGKKEEEKYR
ncbi:MAG: leucine-rich repeat domain-containing protein [Lachnospiraceae bacterium]|nr:leucine-rich repeat domain-containing protein [Lachnospiraceae bacterium]